MCNGSCYAENLAKFLIMFGFATDIDARAIDIENKDLDRCLNLTPHTII
jgi:hypothetical protein